MVLFSSKVRILLQQLSDLECSDYHQELPTTDKSVQEVTGKSMQLVISVKEWTLSQLRVCKLLSERCYKL